MPYYLIQTKYNKQTSITASLLNDIFTFDETDEIKLYKHSSSIKSKATGSYGGHFDFITLRGQFLLTFVTHIIQFYQIFLRHLKMLFAIASIGLLACMN